MTGPAVGAGIDLAGLGLELVVDLVLLGAATYPITWVTAARNRFLASLEILKGVASWPRPVPAERIERLRAGLPRIEPSASRPALLFYAFFVTTLVLFQIVSLLAFDRRYGLDGLGGAFQAALASCAADPRKAYLGYEVILGQQLTLGFLVLFLALSSLAVSHVVLRRLARMNDQCLEAIRKELSMGASTMSGGA